MTYAETRLVQSFLSTIHVPLTLNRPLLPLGPGSLERRVRLSDAPPVRSSFFFPFSFSYQ